eukprot:1141653-Pelagomonas_calceolata.AAC.1
MAGLISLSLCDTFPAVGVSKFCELSILGPGYRPQYFRSAVLVGGYSEGSFGRVDGMLEGMLKA